MRQTRNWIVAVLVSVTAIACGGEKKEAPGGAGSSSASASSPASTNKDIYVDKYRIGRTQNSDGVTGTETDTYQPGDTVYQSFEIRNAPEGSNVRIVFTALADNRKVGELQGKTGKNGFISFAMKDTKGWAPGTYRSEYFLANEGEKPRGMGTHDFKIVASRPGG